MTGHRNLQIRIAITNLRYFLNRMKEAWSQISSNSIFDYLHTITLTGVVAYRAIGPFCRYSENLIP